MCHTHRDQVHNSLRYSLAVEVDHFLAYGSVFQENVSTRTRAKRIRGIVLNTSIRRLYLAISVYSDAV